MAIYKKPNVSLEIYVLDQEYSLEVNDPAVASGVLAELEQGQTLHIPGEEENPDAIIPYHAVTLVYVRTTFEEVTKEDANCVMGEEQAETGEG